MEHPLSDHKLVQQVLNGERHAFNEVITKTEGLVMGIIYKMISDSHDRKDIAQEVYLKVYGSIDKFKFKSKLSTWIGAITYNTCISHLKKKNLIFDEVDILNAASTTIDSELVDLQRRNILRQEIDKLPTIYKTLIMLFHQQEMSYKEIEDITHLPIGTIKNYLYRARKKLKDNLLLKYKIDDL